MNMENIAVGQHVTVIRGRMWDRVVSDGGGLFGGTATVVRSEDRSFKGAVLLVEAIDLPFVVVRQLCDALGSTHYSTQRYSLDTREFEMKTLSPEFVAAMLSAAQPALRQEGERG